MKDGILSLVQNQSKILYIHISYEENGNTVNSTIQKSHKCLTWRSTVARLLQQFLCSFKEQRNSQPANPLNYQNCGLNSFETRDFQENFCWVLKLVCHHVGQLYIVVLKDPRLHYRLPAAVQEMSPRSWLSSGNQKLKDDPNFSIISCPYRYRFPLNCYFGVRIFFRVCLLTLGTETVQFRL